MQIHKLSSVITLSAALGISVAGASAHANNSSPASSRVHEKLIWNTSVFGAFADRHEVKIYINWDGDDFGLKDMFASGHGDNKQDFKRLVRHGMQKWLSTGIDLEVTDVVFLSSTSDLGWDSGEDEFGQLPYGSILICATDDDSGSRARAKADDGKAIVRFYKQRNGDQIIWDMVPSADASVGERRWVYPTLFHELGHTLGLADFKTCEEQEDDCVDDCSPLTLDCILECGEERDTCDAEGDLPPGRHAMISGQSGSVSGAQDRMRGPTEFEVEQLREKYGTKDVRTALYHSDDLVRWSAKVRKIPAEVESYLGVDVAVDESDSDNAYAIAWVAPDSNINAAHLSSSGELRHRNELDISTLDGIAVAHDTRDTALIAYTTADDKRAPWIVRLKNDLQTRTAVAVNPGARILGRPGIAHAADSDTWVYAAIARHNRFDALGRITVWTSDDDGDSWNHRTVLAGDINGLGGISVDCEADGDCRVAFQRTGNASELREPTKIANIRFRLDSNGVPVEDSVDPMSLYTNMCPTIASRAGATRWTLATGGHKWNGSFFRTADRFSDHIGNTQTLTTSLTAIAPLGLTSNDDFDPGWTALIPYQDMTATCTGNCKGGCQTKFNRCWAEAGRDTDLRNECKFARTECHDDCDNKCYSVCPTDYAPDGPQCRIEWSTGIAYEVGAIVNYGGAQYSCRSAHVSQSTWTPDIVPALWERLAPRDGAWTPGVHYHVGDIVDHGGGQFECRQSHRADPGWEPSLTPALWLPY